MWNEKAAAAAISNRVEITFGSPAFCNYGWSRLALVHRQCMRRKKHLQVQRWAILQELHRPLPSRPLWSYKEHHQVGRFSSQKWLQWMPMILTEWPCNWKPSVSSSFKVGWIPFSHYWPSGVIRIGLPVWKWKMWKIFSIKVASMDANDPDWMAL